MKETHPRDPGFSKKVNLKEQDPELENISEIDRQGVGQADDGADFPRDKLDISDT